MDFANDKQMGRTRVNFVSDSKKNRKTHVQFKQNKMTGFDKLCKLQDELFKEGMSFEEYENYIQDKINDEKYYYKSLSTEEIDKLKKIYRKKLTTKENKLNMTLSERNRKNRQTKLLRKRSVMLYMNKRAGIIDALFKEINKTKASVLPDQLIYFQMNQINLLKQKSIYLQVEDILKVKIKDGLIFIKN